MVNPTCIKAAKASNGNGDIKKKMLCLNTWIIIFCLLTCSQLHYAPPPTPTELESWQSSSYCKAANAITRRAAPLIVQNHSNYV